MKMPVSLTRQTIYFKTEVKDSPRGPHPKWHPCLFKDPTLNGILVSYHSLNSTCNVCNISSAASKLTKVRRTESCHFPTESGKFQQRWLSVLIISFLPPNFTKIGGWVL